MITQELVLFIKQQLQEGKSKEQIAGVLTPHGWQLEDINAVFAQIMPSAQPVMPAPVAQPIMTQPAMSAQNSMAQMRPIQMSQTGTMMAQPQVGSGIGYSFRNPTTFFTVIAIAFSAIVSTLLICYIETSQPATVSLTSVVSQNALIAIILGIILAAILVGGLIVEMVTKILSIPNRSFGKAFVFTSASIVISSILALGSLATAPRGILVLPGVIIWAFLFAYYYQVGAWKAIGAFFLNWIVAGIVGILAFFAAGALGFGLTSFLLKSSMNSASKTVILPQTIPAMPVLPGAAGTSASSDTGSVAFPSLAIPDGDTSTLAAEDPEYSHVEDAFPAAYPLPADNEVVGATVVPATDVQGIQYILDYTSTHSLTYIRNAIKTALTSAGYTVSVNETDPNYRVITASIVVRDNVQSFLIVLQQTSTGASVHAVFTE